MTATADLDVTSREFREAVDGLRTGEVVSNTWRAAILEVRGLFGPEEDDEPVETEPDAPDGFVLTYRQTAIIAVAVLALLAWGVV